MLREILGRKNFVSLTALGQRRHYPPGATVFHEGDPGTFLLCIESGEIEISRIESNGRKIVLNHLSRGDLVGEIALLDGGPRSATSTALTDVTGAQVQFDDFRSFLLDRPEIHFGFTLELVAKLRSANAILEDMVQKDAGVRLARCLLRLATGQPGEDARLAMALSQSDLGEIVGLSRANVNRYMRAWTNEGLISVENNVVTLHNITALREIAAR